MKACPHILVLGGNFAGLTTARYIKEHCEDKVKVTVMDRKSYLLFVPNISIEALDNRNPDETMHFSLNHFLDKDKSTFIQGEVKEIDLDGKKVCFVPNERPGSAPEVMRYDYLIIAMGTRLAYDKIQGFSEYGHTVSDGYYGNKLRRYLYGGGYKGGPIAVGSAKFNQGKKGNPSWLPLTNAACDGPVLENALAFAAWLEKRKLGGAKDVTVFSAADLIAEDAGTDIVNSFLEMASKMGFKYEKPTPDIKCIAKDGIEFTSGSSIEAELKIIFPNWEPHKLIKELSIVDEEGFAITDLFMRSKDYKEVFVVGDAAAVTVPKLGSLGHQQAEIAAREIAKDLKYITPKDSDAPFWPEIFCFGDMGNNKAFYIHSDTWYGGKTSIFKSGYSIYALKLAFKELYFRTGGKVPRWGLPLSKFIAEK